MDLISRQAAINGLDKLRPRMIDTYERDGDCFLKVRACDVNDMLQSLPSAQPEPCEDAISRQAAINAMCELMHHWFGGDPKDEIREIKRELEKLPSAEPKQTVSNIIESLPTSPLLVGKMPSVQPKPTADAEFWRKRADYYYDMCSKLIADMGAGVKIEAVKIDETGITFTKKKPPAQPNNQVNLCDSCKYSYPDCPSEADDVIFGNGKGNDNICACNKYLPPAQPEQRWIPCSERLPEEDHWLGGSGRQFSDEVLVSVANYDDENIWTYISQTIDGEWELELPSHCKIIAWMPLPEPYTERREE